MLDLPPETMATVLEFLSARDLAHVANSNRQLSGQLAPDVATARERVRQLGSLAPLPRLRVAAPDSSPAMFALGRLLAVPGSNPATHLIDVVGALYRSNQSGLGDPVVKNVFSKGGDVADTAGQLLTLMLTWLSLPGGLEELMRATRVPGWRRQSDFSYVLACTAPIFNDHDRSTRPGWAQPVRRAIFRDIGRLANVTTGNDVLHESVYIVCADMFQLLLVKLVIGARDEAAREWVRDAVAACDSPEVWETGAEGVTYPGYLADDPMYKYAWWRTEVPGVVRDAELRALPTIDTLRELFGHRTVLRPTARVPRWAIVRLIVAASVPPSDEAYASAAHSVDPANEEYDIEVRDPFAL